MANNNNPDEKNSLLERLPGMVIMGCVGGAAIIGGFGYTLSSSRKSDPVMFAKGMEHSWSYESGQRLARRALGLGTLYAVGGFSLVCLGVWKFSGAQNFPEFRQAMQTKLPVVPKKPVEQQGRSEFESITELFQHLIDVDNEEKLKKQMMADELRKYENEKS